MAEVLSDDVTKIVILASSTIIFSSCALLFNEMLERKSVILSGFKVICSLAINMALTSVSCETWKFTPKKAGKSTSVT